MKISSPKILITLITALFFLFWTILFNVSRRMYENYDIKLTKIANEEESLYKENNILRDQLMYLPYPEENYSSNYINISKKRLGILENINNNENNLRQLTEQRISNSYFLYFIFPEYREKDELYLENINWRIKTIRALINLTNEGIASTGIGTPENIRLDNEANASNVKSQETRTLFEEFFWRYNMHKTLIYQWPKGSVICVASSLLSLVFIILSITQIYKLALTKHKIYLLALLVIAIIIFLYTFVFFGPLMILPKIPYISW